MLKSIRLFLRCEDGATVIEYGLICSLIAIVLITAVTTTGKSLNKTYTSVGTTIK